ncbi:hypothetical protein DFJ77DRAFT_88547 [Powellomyces hirtus]|nr:hypothetical protein DFJ77DRAFT_88547 [Powellomyces hirtus]
MLSSEEERPVGYRVGYVDILRLFAAVIIMNGNFARATFDRTTNSMPLDTPMGIFRDTDWALILLFMISGRILTATAMPPAPTPAGFRPNYPKLVSSMFRRAFRFAFPVIVVAFMQWQLCAKGHTNYATTASERVFNGPGPMAQVPAGWCGIQDFRGYLVYIINLFTFTPSEPSSTPLKSQQLGSMLWPTTWQMWGSYTVYLTAFLTAQLASNRYVIFATLMAFSWVTYSSSWVFLLGYLIHDLTVHGHLARPRNKVAALAMQIGSLALAVVLVWVVPLRDVLRDAFRSLQISQISHNDMISFPNTLSVFFLLIFFEISPSIQRVLSARFLKHAGHLACGVILLHPTFLATLIPRLALALYPASPSHITGICWIALLGLCFGSAFFFYQLIELQSVLLGIHVWRFVAKRIDDGTVPGDKIKGDRYSLITEKDNTGKAAAEETVVDVLVVSPDGGRLTGKAPV